jgi:hypothetical protein
MNLDLPVRSQELRGSRFGGSPSLAAQPSTQPKAADACRHAAHPVCDFCRSALRREERHRLVWKSPFQAELVLADLCSRCASRGDDIVELYGGREAITLVHEGQRAKRYHGVVAFLIRGVVYLLIAVAFFLIVTLISSYAHAG